MPASAVEERYSTVAVVLHWLIALAIIANIALGLTFADMSNSDPAKFPLAQLHKSIGLTVLLLSLARVVWRLIHPVPPLPAGMSAPLRLAAHISHFLLYFLIIAIPLTGWALVSSSPLGLPTIYFGWFAWPDLPYFSDLPRAAKKMWTHEFAATHVFLAWSAIVVVTIHLAAAFYHHFVRRDVVLARMLPPLRKAEKA
ncbi:MAG TPA: cytochrome b [Rhizomicrobium sp.]|nr:cytochrome b [Rhizomicrobium sp.]